jgi:hypothetical protein
LYDSEACQYCGEDSKKNNEGKGGRLLDDHPSIDSRIEKNRK